MEWCIDMEIIFGIIAIMLSIGYGITISPISAMVLVMGFSDSPTSNRRLQNSNLFFCLFISLFLIFVIGIPLGLFGFGLYLIF